MKWSRYLDADCWMTAFTLHDRMIGEQAMTGRFGSSAVSPRWRKRSFRPRSAPTSATCATPVTQLSYSRRPQWPMKRRPQLPVRTSGRGERPSDVASGGLGSELLAAFTVIGS